MKDGAVFIADGIHAGSTITFAELSEILEYGRYDKHFSGFPHWRPTIEQFRPRAEKILLNFLSKKV